MSCFIVQHSTINAIVYYITTKKPHSARGFGKLANDGQQLASALWAMNHAAYDARYQDSSEVPTFDYTPCGLEKIELFKRVSCLVYQCGEGNIHKTKLYKALVDFKHELACDIAKASKGYEAANWA